MMVAFTYLRVPRGRRAAICSGGGGLCVIGTDEYTAAGFLVPPLPTEGQQEVWKEISAFVNTDAGFILNNPFDLTNLHSAEGQHRVFKRLADCGGFDFLTAQISVNNSGWPYPDFGYSDWPDLHSDAAIRVQHETDIPVAVIIFGVLSEWDSQRALALPQKCYEAGLPVFR